jgi:hypothetical protein
MRRLAVPNRWAILLVGLMGAGCSGGDQGSRGVSAQMIDGVYKGRSEAIVSRSPVCPAARVGQVEIGDQTLHFPFTPSTLFITPVQPDGTVRTELPDAKLEGRLADGRLQFTVANPVCQTRYDLHRVL